MGLFWTWLNNIVAKSLSAEKKQQINDIFQKERRMEKMVYAIEKIMEQERIDATKEGAKAGAKEGANEEKIRIARKLLEARDSIEKVQMVTDLPLSTIHNLAQSMQSKQ